MFRSIRFLPRRSESRKSPLKFVADDVFNRPMLGLKRNENSRGPILARSAVSQHLKAYCCLCSTLGWKRSQATMPIYLQKKPHQSDFVTKNSAMNIVRPLTSFLKARKDRRLPFVKSVPVISPFELVEKMTLLAIPWLRSTWRTKKKNEPRTKLIWNSSF